MLDIEVQQGALSPVEQGSVTFKAAAMATAASAALPPCCSMRIPACKERRVTHISWYCALHTYCWRLYGRSCEVKSAVTCNMRPSPKSKLRHP